jgi:hypothetical protein
MPVAVRHRAAMLAGMADPNRSPEHKSTTAPSPAQGGNRPDDTNREPDDPARTRPPAPPVKPDAMPVRIRTGIAARASALRPPI